MTDLSLIHEMYIRHYWLSNVEFLDGCTNNVEKLQLLLAEIVKKRKYNDEDKIILNQLRKMWMKQNPEPDSMANTNKFIGKI